MNYTSGTTGRPKGVWIGRARRGRRRRAACSEEQELWGFDARRRAPRAARRCTTRRRSASPGGRSSPAATSCCPAPFDVGTCSRARSPTHRPTTAFCTPAHLQRLFDRAALPALASLRLVAHAGAPCPEPLKRRAIELFPAGSVWEFYGSTEGQFTVCASDDWLERPGTVGRARPGRSLATGRRRRRSGAGRRRGPRWEYWRDPERTAAAWRGDAFTVGDLGRLDDDGYLFLDGRRERPDHHAAASTSTRRGGAGVSRHPGVDDVVVFGRPTSGGAAGVRGRRRDVTADEVDAFAAGRLAPYKRPKDVLVDEIPVSAWPRCAAPSSGCSSTIRPPTEVTRDPATAPRARGPHLGPHTCARRGRHRRRRR